jgi:hypothetical protein
VFGVLGEGVVEGRIVVGTGLAFLVEALGREDLCVGEGKLPGADV